MISTDATIVVERSVTDRLISSLRPFIAKVAAGVRENLELSAAVDAAARAHDSCSQYFVIEKDLSTFGLRPELLFCDNDRMHRIAFKNRKTKQSVEINNLIDDEVGEIGKLLHLLSTRNGNRGLLDTTAYPRLVQALLDVEIFVSETTPTNWEIRSKESGIVRLQHASFFLKTRKARILVDPHFVSGYSSHLQPGSLMLPQNFNSSIDAVLITHSHTDHYHVPSLMMLPRDTLIIVPNVSDESILCPRFANELRAIGFKNVVEPEWYSEPICVEDIEILALPFYGEQPLRYGHPRDKRLRNWGNTYLFRTPEFSAWCLIDSGSDGDGSMIHVAQSVKNQFGSINVVLSNLQEFYVGVGRADPFYITGSGHYWLSLTADQIVRLPQMSQDLLTLGTKGVAEICSIVEAKTFLPYSHLWSEIGTAPPSESKMLQELNAEKAFTTSGTQIESWRIGDTWRSDRRAG